MVQEADLAPGAGVGPEELALRMGRVDQVGIADGVRPPRAVAPQALQPHPEALAGTVHLPAAAQQLPRQGDLLHEALTVGVLNESLLRALGEGVGHLASVGALGVAPAIVDGDAGLAGVAVVPAVHPGHAVGHHSHLHAVRLPAPARVLPGVDMVDHRQGVLEVEGHVEEVAVVHRRSAHRVLIHQRSQVVADEDPAGEVPVVQLSINHDLAWRRHRPEFVVVGLLREGYPKTSQHRAGRWEHASEHRNLPLISVPGRRKCLVPLAPCS